MQNGQLQNRIDPTWYAALVGLALLVPGCAGKSEVSQPAQRASGSERPAPSANAAASGSPDLGYHMRASFWDAVRARDALIKGDLATAQSAARELAKHEYGKLLPEDWKHWVAGMQQYADALSMAPNLTAAAAELGRLALVCGDCHDLHEQGPERPRTKPLPWEDPPEAFDARMHRHQLGVAQMWDGLVIPSEQAWRSGTITITRAPLRAPEVEGEPVAAAMVQAVEEVRKLAKQARLADTYEERGRVYGELIARCANCHTIARPATATR